jgi:CHAT domain-containing protein
MPSWIETFAEQDISCARAALPDDAPEQVHGAVLSALYRDVSRAAYFAGVARRVAQIRPDPVSRAFAAKCDAHIAYIRGEHERAVAGYEEAWRLFDACGAEVECAKTLSSGLQSLILLGRYDQAWSWAARAEAVFRKHGDVLRLARLDSNAGNIHFRQDEPRKAIIRYERALEGFRAAGDAKDICAVLSNMAVCHTSLANFGDAFSSYERARDIALRNGLHPLAAQADYNIAYLHYLRGEYRIARKLYEACRAHADPYHSALCDLDEAELLLELNLSAEGAALAARAERSLGDLGMRYEQGKAMVNSAVAASQRGDLKGANATLRAAYALFVAEGNRTWAAMTDLLRAVLAYHDRRFQTARKLSTSAWRVLAETPLPGRAAYCQILLARLWLREGSPERALDLVSAALQRLGPAASPSIRFHSRLLEAEVHQLAGRRAQAIDAYELARLEIEDLRARVDAEDLRISLLKDKLSVYDALVSLILEPPDEPAEAGVKRALLLVQQAKSRTLVDRLQGSYEPASPSAEYDSLRTELNWCYRQIEDAGAGTSRIPTRARHLEERLSQLRPKLIGPALAPVDSTAAIQAALPPRTALIEFFETRAALFAFVVNKDNVSAVRLERPASVRRHLQLLQFQLGKAALGDTTHSLAATEYHLCELYRMLIAPLATKLENSDRLVIAPHGYLHALPFAALHDGTRTLLDRFTVSIVPSASVYVSCRTRSGPRGTGVMVLAAPNTSAPNIVIEASAVARILPDARIFLGAHATVDALRTHAPDVDILHVAAHGEFRADNPLFSSLRLYDGHFSFVDLQSLELKANLVTLSACSTGLALSVAGDELLGLMRGFLAAGARNLLVSLGEVDDSVTAELMKSFYSGVLRGAEPASALRSAMLQVRERHPHPFYWASFTLVGASVSKMSPHLIFFPRVFSLFVLEGRR